MKLRKGKVYTIKGNKNKHYFNLGEKVEIIEQADENTYLCKAIFYRKEYGIDSKVPCWFVCQDDLWSLTDLLKKL